MINGIMKIKEKEDPDKEAFYKNFIFALHQLKSKKDKEDYPEIYEEG